MKILKKIIYITAVIFFVAVFTTPGFCYRVPPEESNIKYLYVFGPDGSSNYGAIKRPQIVFLRVPEDFKGEINISIFDPGVTGSLDEKVGVWDTETKFSIFGGDGAYTSLEGISPEKMTDYNKGELLDTMTFGADKEYDKSYYKFSGIDAEKGEKSGNFIYFKIVAEGIKGDDNNIFSLDISPDSAESFSYELSMRLAEKRGTKMALYPDIAGSEDKIIEHNYDLDSTGGEIELISPSRTYKVNGSGSGEWVTTEIDVVTSDAGKKWVYEITKDRQKDANMAIYLTNGKGAAVPVFFQPGELGPKRVIVESMKEEPWMESKLSCKTFTFDGSKSYDLDKQELSYFWDFGDGTTSNEIKTMHTYREPGKYLVKLTVTDTSDAECKTATTQQVVKVNQPPCAVAAGPEISCINDEVTFDASKSTDSPEDKLTYRWEFGDGGTAEGVKVKHVYKKGGNYQVALTVMDDSGSMCDTGVDKIKIYVNTPPIADAGKDAFLCKKDINDKLQVTFDASLSSDADANSMTYSWDFGDGEKAEGKVVNHTYKKGGKYLAKLIVMDSSATDCNKSTSTRLVTVNRSPIASAGENISVCSPQKVSIDASGSSDTDGDNLIYTWDLGDGEKAEGKVVSHKYTKGGLYQVKLTVDDGSDTECSSTTDKILVDVNEAPKAEISSIDTSCVNQPVGFDASSSRDLDGDKLKYSWDFGDGAVGSGVNAKHSYAKGGLYKATLVVDDGKGLDCSTAISSHYIKVNTAPVADIGPNLICCINDRVEFDGSKSYDPDGNTLKYTWDFGDGETAEGAKATHSYKNIGVYKVALVVTDNSGTECNTSKASFLATVNAEPVPVMEVI